MELKVGNSKVNILIIVYFAISISEITAESFAYTPLLYILKPMIPVTLVLLYYNTSVKRAPIFGALMFFSLLTNLFFIPNTPQMIYYGLIAFAIHRIIVIYFVITLLRIRDFIPVIIATLPFLLVFFYMFFITEGIPENSFVVLILQNILISVLCGISFAHYMMNDNNRNSWLLICGILFGSLQFIVFIEKFYLSGLSPLVFRPVVMGLNVFAFYTFYEFVIATERSNQNGSPEF